MNIFFSISSKLLRNPVTGSQPEGGASNGDEDQSSTEIDDEILVKQAQAGDYEAFDDLVNRHRGRIYAMIMNMIKNNADAWDLTQDAFIKAWKALPKFKNRSKFSTWLFRIAHNVVYDWKRKNHIEAEGELDDNLFSTDRIDPNAKTVPSLPANPDKALLNTELRQQIEAALEKISVKHREVILLREVQGLDYKEIAEVLGCSIGTVMSRIHNARKKLQNLLS